MMGSRMQDASKQIARAPTAVEQHRQSGSSGAAVLTVFYFFIFCNLVGVITDCQ
jgi:hypothetical protein